MNIKIQIRDAQNTPVLTKNTLSEVQHKKKSMLYSPPQKDNKTGVKKTQQNKNTIVNNQNTNQNNNNNNKYSSLQTTQQQKMLMKQLDQASKNQVSLDFIQNGQRIAQKNNEILQDNQRTLYQMINQKPNQESASNRQDIATRNALVSALEKVSKDVQQISKLRNQIVKVGQDVKRSFDQAKNNGRPARVPQQISQMNANLKNLTQVSQNHLEGLENLQALKQLQNFNVNVYAQSVDKLKRQIIQYQKQSENIQKQLRNRAAKLQKLQIPKNFDDQLIQPYQKYLQGKTNSVNLHAIRDKVYEKIGIFDYGRFENDVFEVMNQVKNCMAQFKFVCKQNQIEVPTMKIDPKQLKNLDTSMPSILEDYKAIRGINFKQQKATKQNFNNNQGNINNTNQIRPATKKDSSLTKNNNAKRNQLKSIITKPLDMANNVKYTRKDKQQSKTILQTQQQIQKKNLQQRMKNGNSKNRQQDEFNKYLQNRARQQLQSLYQQKRDNLRKMQKQLYEEYQQPVHITLNLQQRNKFQRQAKPNKRRQQSKQKISPQKSKKKEQVKQQQQQDYEDDFEQQKEKIKKDLKKNRNSQPNQHGFKNNNREKSKQALKQKLKQLLGKDEKVIPKQNNIMRRPESNQNQNYNQNQGGNINNLGSLAEGFVALINNTLTQVNNNLSKNIEQRVLSKEKDRQASGQKRQNNRSPGKRIAIPKLQQFRPPPTFNLNINNNNTGYNSINNNQGYNSQNYIPINNNIIETRKVKVAEQKIVPKNYDHLKIGNDNQELYVSDFSNDDDN